MKFELGISNRLFKRPSLLRMLIESLILTVAILLLFYEINDSLFFDFKAVKFPWIFVVPIFCALYYTLSLGFLSLMLVIFCLIWHYPEYFYNNPSLLHTFLGGGLLTFIAGLFAANWQRHVTHVEHLNYYLLTHLENLSKDYFSLKLSHERLEHTYITKPMSFREALYSLKNELGNSNLIFNEESALKFLTIISQYCSISNAALVIFEEKNQTPKTLAFLGGAFEINMNDPLIVDMLREKATSYVAVNSISLTQKSEYLAVIPFIRKSNQIIGFTVLKDMPFWSLNEENLEALSVFSSVLIMNTSLYPKLREFFNMFPNIDKQFLVEMHQLRQLKKFHSVDSVLGALIVPAGTLQKEIIYGMRQSKRAMDHLFVLEGPKYHIILILLPLSSMPAAFSYQKRLAQWFKTEFGLVLNQNGFIYRYRMLNEEKTGLQLQQFLDDLRHECS